MLALPSHSLFDHVAVVDTQRSPLGRLERIVKPDGNLVWLEFFSVLFDHPGVDDLGLVHLELVFEASSPAAEFFSVSNQSDTLVPFSVRVEDSEVDLE